MKKVWDGVRDWWSDGDRSRAAQLEGVVALRDVTNADLVDAIQAQATAMALLEDRNADNVDKATATIGALVMMHGGSVVVSKDVATAALAGGYRLKFVNAEDGSTAISLEVVEHTAGVSDVVSETPEAFKQAAANNSAALAEMGCSCQ
jgi:hypothetical protein